MPEPSAPFSASPPTLTLGAGAAAYDEAVTKARDEGWAERLFAKDTSLWSSDARVQAGHRRAARLARRPGPLHRPDRRPRGLRRGDPRRRLHDRDRRRHGRQQPRPGRAPRRRSARTRTGSSLRVLDSTDPAAVAAAVDDLDPLATLLIVASKSGTTTEPLAFLADAWARDEAALRAHHAPRFEHAGELIVAITDPGQERRGDPPPRRRSARSSSTRPTSAAGTPR